MTVRTKTRKLRRKYRRKPHDIRFGSDFFDQIAKAQAIKNIDTYIGLYQNLKCLCVEKHHQQRDKTSHRMRDQCK